MIKLHPEKEKSWAIQWSLSSWVKRYIRKGLMHFCQNRTGQTYISRYVTPKWHLYVHNSMVILDFLLFWNCKLQNLPKNSRLQCRLSIVFLRTIVVTTILFWICKLKKISNSCSNTYKFTYRRHFFLHHLFKGGNYFWKYGTFLSYTRGSSWFYYKMLSFKTKRCQGLPLS